jgi:hypothetical protein
MAMAIAEVVVNFLSGYAIAGVFFAIYFGGAGAGRIDSDAKEAPLGVRLILMPGAVALWPLLLPRVIRGTGQPPEERNRHRTTARIP